MNQYAAIYSADGPTTIFSVGSIGNIFLIPSFSILILFYAIYFIKLYSQKRKGTQTNQLKQHSDKTIRIIETILQFASILIVPVQIISILFEWNMLPENIRMLGVILGIAGDFIFLAAIVTMKDSWRAGISENDNTDFISSSIYRYSRNPTFLGFDLMYIGIVLQYFNLLLFSITIFTILIFHIQIVQEEKYLTTVFGEKYLTYKKQVRRYLGRK